MQQIHRQLRAVQKRWETQPLRLAAFVALIGCVVVSGPWACVAHCLMLDQMLAHTHGHRHHMAEPGFAMAEECPVELQGSHHQMGDPPSAITVGVLLALLLLPLLRVAAFQPIVELAQETSAIHAPPRYPPRRTLSLI